MLEFCRDLSDEDGTDPREFFMSKRTRLSTDNRKARQLSRQVAETLALTLNNIGDDDLAVLSVVSVEPAPDSSRLLVTLHADRILNEADRARLEEKLAQQTGRLRCEVAAAITRKKTPAIAFRVLEAPSITTEKP